MYNRDEILELVKTAGFKKVKYRKISPFTFQCIAKSRIPTGITHVIPSLMEQ